MKNALLLFIFTFSSFLAVAQTPAVSLINIPGDETFPSLIPTGTGGYYLTSSIRKFSPDSLHASITYMDSNLAPQWSRLIKAKSNTPVYNAEIEPGGGISVMLTTYNSQTQSSPVFCRFDANGNVAETIELLDSSTANLTTSPVFHKIKLGDGSRVFLSSSFLVHVNPQGKADFARQYKYGVQGNNNITINSAAVFPGSNTWYVGGYINNTNLHCLMKMQDTTLVSVRVYDLKPHSNVGFNTMLVQANGDILTGWNDGSRQLQNLRLSPDGNIIWRKTHKMSNNPGGMKLTSNGDIWMHGSITPGQAGGILVHLSPTGQFIGRKGQFKLGNSHGNISALVELPNNELLTMQKGFYTTNSILFVNRIHTSMDFYCYDAIVGNFIDTTYAISDSATTLVRPFLRRFGSKSTLTSPLTIRNLTVTTGNVVCTPTLETAEVLTSETYSIFPNPATNGLKISGMVGQPFVRIFAMDGRVLHAQPYLGEISVSGLSPGIYLLEVPSIGLRRRFVKD